MISQSFLVRNYIVAHMYTLHIVERLFLAAAHEYS
jgi:hypothetical protein